MRLFDKAHYDFLAVRKTAYVITALLAATGLTFLAVRGVNESIEFTGGTEIQLQTNQPDINTGTLRSALNASGIRGAEIQTFGAPNEFIIRAQVAMAGTDTVSTQQAQAVVDSALTHKLGKDAYTIEGVYAVSPRVGSELRTKAVTAVLLSFGATLIYLWFRFEWRFAVGAILATVHDIIGTVAFISMLHLEISLVVVAAVLTIVGYSLNDTIIVFDRVRENLRKYKRQNLYEVLNLSVNETLPRTVLTAGTTLVATLALLIFGGEVIRGFAWVMTFGIATGTFSSIYIASPVFLWIERRWPGEDARGARALPSPAAATPEAG
ncbi:MAG TPA: protein translocase subunit SecF [Gemmatimonadales bacterium]|nr:protein translocase subunit SecF [Gemmatimonadales bacterium]